MDHKRTRYYIILFIFTAIGLGMFILLPSFTQLHIQNRTSFEADWEGPFFTITFGKLLGYLPSQFFYNENNWKNRRGSDEFFMALDDDGGKAWIRINSDIKQESAVWLPRKSKDILNKDVIRFIRALRRMFADTSRHSMKGIFTFSKKKLNAEAIEYELSQVEIQKFNQARAFNVTTFDTTGSPNIGGRVVITRDSVVHYKKVSVYLPNDEIKVELEEKD